MVIALHPGNIEYNTQLNTFINWIHTVMTTTFPPFKCSVVIMPGFIAKFAIEQGPDSASQGALLADEK